MLHMVSNKIKGALLGYAIGDALGLGTEFMTRSEIHRRYPQGLTHYSQIIRDAHRSQWRRGEYTADTHIILALVNSLCENGQPDCIHCARKLQEWFLATDGQDVGSHIRMVLSHPDYAERPLEVARDVYEKQRYFEAHNESLGRAFIMGLWPEFDETKVSEIVQITHYDSRCVATGVVIARMAHDLLWHGRSTEFSELRHIGERIDKRVSPFINFAAEGTLDDFELDDDATLWYTRKAMGAALWALWHHSDPEKALHEIVAAGGDADTNASLALGLMGIKYGFDALPKRLIEDLIGHEEIEQTAEELASLLEKVCKQ